ALPKLAKVVYHAAFSPDGVRLVTANSNGVVAVWDVASGRELMQWPAHSGAATWAEYNPTGTLVVTSGKDGTAKVWTAADGRQVAGGRAGGWGGPPARVGTPRSRRAGGRSGPGAPMEPRASTPGSALRRSPTT